MQVILARLPAVLRSVLACGSISALILSAGACSDLQRSQLAAKKSDVLSLEFTTSTDIPSNPPPALDITVRDAAKAQAVYEATLDLPPPPSGIHHCPLDEGIHFHLTFRSGSEVVTQADLQAGGCGFVSIAGILGNSWVEETNTYWPTLAKSLGIMESELFP